MNFDIVTTEFNHGLLWAYNIQPCKQTFEELSNCAIETVNLPPGTTVDSMSPGLLRGGHVAALAQMVAEHSEVDLYAFRSNFSDDFRICVWTRAHANSKNVMIIDHLDRDGTVEVI